MKCGRIQWAAVLVALLTAVVVGAGLMAAASPAVGQPATGMQAGASTTSLSAQIATDAANTSVPPGRTAWPMAAVDAGNTRHLDTTGLTKPITERWQFRTKDERFTQQVVANGKIYFVGVDRSCTPDPRGKRNPDCRDHAEHVYAVEAESGEEHWRLSLGHTAIRAPAVVDDTVYVPSSKGVFALDAETGTVQWRTELSGRGSPSSPIVAEGSVYVTIRYKNPETETWDSRVYALASSTGEARWTKTTKGLPSKVAVVNGMVYRSGAKKVFAFDAATGNRRWSVEVGDGLDAPTVAHGLVYISDNSKNTFALDAQTGEEQWTHKGSGGAAVADNTVYLTRNGKLYAVDAETGTRRWAVEAPDNTPFLVNGTAYIVGGRTIYALNAENGNELARYTVDDPEASRSGGPTIVDGSLYIAYRFGDTRSNPNLFNDTRLIALGSTAMSFANLSISPQAVTPGEPVTVTATVTNTGTSSGTFNARLVVNGSVVSSGEASLDAGAQTTVEFTHVFRETGTYSIGINQLSQSITVTSEPLESPSPTKTAATPTAGGKTTTSPTVAQTTTATDTSTPGFGIGIGVLAVFVVFGLLGRTSRRD